MKRFERALVSLVAGATVSILTVGVAIKVIAGDSGGLNSVIWDGPRLLSPTNHRPEVVERNGSEDCGWDGLRVLVVPVDVVPSVGETVEHLFFARESNGARGHEMDRLTGDSDGVATLPHDAVPTDYTSGDRQLWFAPSDAGRYVYIVEDENIERWPRFDGGCD